MKKIIDSSSYLEMESHLGWVLYLDRCAIEARAFAASISPALSFTRTTEYQVNVMEKSALSLYAEGYTRLAKKTLASLVRLTRKAGKPQLGEGYSAILADTARREKK